MAALDLNNVNQRLLCTEKVRPAAPEFIERSLFRGMLLALGITARAVGSG